MKKSFFLECFISAFVALCNHYLSAMGIAENINRLKEGLKSNVTLVAVSKTKPVEDIRTAYGVGQRIFGENKVQELVDKYEQLPKDIEWHFIGHLQRNKVKYIASFVSLVHAVDSLQLLSVINREAGKQKRSIACLLQFHIARESSKFGLSREEAVELLSSEEYQKMTHVKICGVMGMATFTEDKEQVHHEFSGLKNIFEELKVRFFEDQSSFSEISMGMSGDYPEAVDEGSTMIRVGTGIFGARQKKNE